MNEHFRNRLAMLDATLEHFDQHPDVWQDTTVIVPHVAAVREARDGMVEADRTTTAIGAIADAYEDTLHPLTLLDRLVPALIADAAFVAEYEQVRRILGE